jgi:hypothetical protein
MRFPKRPAVILTKPFEGPGRAVIDTDLERIQPAKNEFTLRRKKQI